MPPLQAEQLGDLVKTTQNELGEMKFVEIASDLQRKIALSQLMKKNKVVFDSGTQWQWDIMVDHNHSCEFVGLYGTDNVDVPDVMIQAQVPWRHCTASYAIERREIAMNRAPRKIVDLVKTRRLACMISIAEKMEERFWRAPAAGDTLNPYGVPYWIVKNNTEGFNGGAPTGFTTVGNVSPTDYARWRNWTAQYTAITKDDLIRKWRKAATYTDFTPHDGVTDFNTGDSYAFYTNYSVVGTLEEMLEAQNDNLGNDVASMDGKVQFRRVPVIWVPKLDEDTTDPVYGINWGEFKTAVLKGEWLNETRLEVTPGQHTVASTFVDCSFNWFTRNRRRHFVLAKNTTMPG